jgi:hypothetical protein
MHITIICNDVIIKNDVNHLFIDLFSGNFDL